jgi:Zn-dependent peptidase ImmA (M78 family)/transcriptional regulator with XRE-family HTH domain
MSADVNAQLLGLGRELRGLTQSQLAKITGINQGLISKYESDLRQIPDHDLELIAEALELPTSFFLRQGAVYAPNATSIYHRALQSLPATQSKKLHSRLNALRMNVAVLLDSVDFEAPFVIPEYDTDLRAPDEIAAMVRASWNIPPGPIGSMVDTLENAGCMIFAFDFGTPKADAISQRIAPMMPIILLNSERPADRQRFDLAHELGHLVMHRKQLPKTPNEGEDEANAFAAAFLMPHKDIVPDLSEVRLDHLAQLKLKWKVSIQALIRRAKDIGKINDRRYSSLMVEMSKLGYKRNEPNPVPVEQPRLLKALIDVHLRQLGYSLTDMSRKLAMHEWELKSLYLGTGPALRLVKDPSKPSSAKLNKLPPA